MVPAESSVSTDTRIVAEVDKNQRVIVNEDIWVEFRDAAGQWWQRNPAGELTPIGWPFWHRAGAGMA